MRTVKIVKDHLPQNQINLCLKMLISEIGKYYGKNDVFKTDNVDYFKFGISFLNRRLHKNHKKAINNLTRARTKKFNHPGIEKTKKYVWRINRKKAIKIFQLIKPLINHIDNQEIKNIFNDTYIQLQKYGVEKRGDSLVAFPYYLDIVRDENLSSLVEEVKTFAVYY